MSTRECPVGRPGKGIFCIQSNACLPCHRARPFCAIEEFRGGNHDVSGGSALSIAFWGREKRGHLIGAPGVEYILFPQPDFACRACCFLSATSFRMAMSRQMGSEYTVSHHACRDLTLVASFAHGTATSVPVSRRIVSCGGQGRGMQCSSPTMTARSFFIVSGRFVKATVGGFMRGC